MKARVTIFFLLALVLIFACDKREVLNVHDDDELIRYLRQVPTALELFRTDSLVTSDPYFKSSDPGAEFRDFTDSITRHIYQYITPDTVEKNFGPPFLFVDDAEVRVDDRIYLTTQQVLDSDTSYYSHVRYLNRWAYFLRIGHDAYSGWVLHAFNGGQPRQGGASFPTQYFTVTRENGDNVQGGDYQGFHYEEYHRGFVTKSFYDPVEGSFYDSTFYGVDTITNCKSRMSYILLSEIARIPYGDRLILQGVNVPTLIPFASVYQLVAWFSDSGYTTSQMVRTAPDEYIDTIFTASDNPYNFNLLYIQEYQYVDRHGAMWVLPYRAVSDD